MADIVNLEMPGYAPPAGDGSGTFLLLAPARHCCQTCGRDHPADYPHDPNSLYWQTKRQMIGWPTPRWPEALGHCTPQMRAHWLDQLRASGVDIDAGETRPNRGRRA